MDRLEKYIRDNRNLFDENEPEVGHFARFEELLDKQPGSEKSGFNKSFFLKIAAGILVLLMVTIFLFDFPERNFSGAFQNSLSGADLPSDLKETVDYYQNSAETNLIKIEKLACCGEEPRRVLNIANNELDVLDANTKELKECLKKNPNDDRIQSALIRNQRMKETILNNMILKMERSKK